MLDADITELIEQCSEIDEYQFKIILSSHNIKVQTYIVNRIENNTKLQKQACDSLRKMNMLLDTKTKIDEQNRKNLVSAIEANKLTNIENKKHLLLAELEEQNIINRKKIFIKKYEEQWLNAKQRLENNAPLQRYLALTNKIESKRQNIKKFNTEIESLNVNINVKRGELLNLDKKYVIKLAEYLIHKRPTVMEQIKYKQIQLDKLKKATIVKGNVEKCFTNSNRLSSFKTADLRKDTIDVNLKYSWTDFSNYLGDAILPKLRLQNENCDLVTTRLDQVKNIDEKCTLSVEKTNNFEASNIQIKKYIPEQNISDVYLSSYFTSPIISSQCNNEPNTYSNMKLVNVLEDIKLDTVKTCSIISNLKSSELKEVNLIEARCVQNNLNEKKISQEKVNKLINNKEIEEIDLTKNNSKDILVPPPQFLDLTQSLEEEQVISNSVISVQKSTDLIPKNNEFIIVKDNNASIEFLDNHLKSKGNTDDSYFKIEETLYNNNNLNLSPIFKYTKKQKLHNVTKDKNNDKVYIRQNVDLDSFQSVVENTIKSKNLNGNNICEDEDCNNDNIKKHEMIVYEVNPEQTNQVTTTDNILIKVQEDEQKYDAPIFQPSLSHCLPSTSNYLDFSMNTTITSVDFPHCIDSNVLLSPEADNDELSIKDNNYREILSQEVPNFLAGFKKTRFSLFEAANTDNKADTDIKNQNNFNFNFGEEQKCKRGNFFNILE